VGSTVDTVLVVAVEINIVGYNPHIHERKDILSHERGKSEGIPTQVIRAVWQCENVAGIHSG
jgi:Mlc titration factor MtfA (ptsG expression regulator)